MPALGRFVISQLSFFTNGLEKGHSPHRAVACAVDCWSASLASRGYWKRNLHLRILNIHLQTSHCRHALPQTLRFILSFNGRELSFFIHVQGHKYWSSKIKTESQTAQDDEPVWCYGFLRWHTVQTYHPGFYSGPAINITGSSVLLWPPSFFLEEDIAALCECRVGEADQMLKLLAWNLFSGYCKIMSRKDDSCFWWRNLKTKY